MQSISVKRAIHTKRGRGANIQTSKKQNIKISQNVKQKVRLNPAASRDTQGVVQHPPNEVKFREFVPHGNS